MPKPPRFPTARAQQIAVAVITFVAFGAAMGLAQIYSQSQHMDYSVELAAGRVDELVLPLPVGWVRDDQPLPDRLFSGRPAVFADPRVPGRQLTVARIDLAEPAASDDVMRRLLAGIAGNRQSLIQDGKAARFRGLSSAGVYYHGNRLVDDVGLSVSDWMVVLTEDQRRHWMILLTMPTRTSAAAQNANAEILLKIAAAADDTAILNVNTDPPAPADR